jgi:uracil-DNA glycosylase
MSNGTNTTINLMTSCKGIRDVGGHDWGRAINWFQGKGRLDVLDRLDWHEDNGLPYTPHRADLFRALHLCPYHACRVVFVLQNPYPNPKYATGVALSASKWLPIVGTPEHCGIPQSLRTIYAEYSSDLGLPTPEHGCLEQWCARGVLLWNAVLTTEITRGKLGQWEHRDHSHWPEYADLTEEIITALSNKGGIVFVFFGAKAKKFAQYVKTEDKRWWRRNTCMFFVHPSPLARHSTNNPIIGSRMFSTINDHLVKRHRQEPIDWRIT